MKNEEIFKKLNDETKKYLITMNKLANFFYENKNKIKVHEYDKNKDIEIIRNLYADEIIYFSSLFAILKTNKTLKDKFKEYDITYKNIFEKFIVEDNNLKAKFLNLLNGDINTEDINRINLNNIFNDLYDSFENEFEDKYIDKNDNFYKQITPINIFYNFEYSNMAKLFSNILENSYKFNDKKLLLLNESLEDIFSSNLDEFLNSVEIINESFSDRFPINVFDGFIIYKNKENYYLKFDDFKNVNRNLIISIENVNDNNEKLNLLDIKDSKLKIKSINGNIINSDENDILSYLYDSYDDDIDEFPIIFTYNNNAYEIKFRKFSIEINTIVENFDKLKKLRNEKELEKNPKYKLDKRFRESFLIIDKKDKKDFQNKMENTSTDNYVIINENIEKDENQEIIDSIMNGNDNDLNLSSLNKYGYELTKETYLKDPSVGREDVLKRIEQILLYPEKDKSIILTGRAGCGKTSIVRGLAYRIQKGDVPDELKDLRVFSISTSTLVAGTKYVGTLEEKMEKILKDASKSKNILLFIDEIHQTIGAGKTENSENSVSEILKPYLDTGRVRVIGSTTEGEYQKYINEDEAYKTRFKKISVSEPTNDVIYEILNDLITSYNKFSYSKLLVSDEEKDMIIKWLIESTQDKFRTYNDKSGNPRMVIDILKEAYAISAYYNRHEVLVEDIITALINEDRLYKSSKTMQIQKLKNMKPQKHECEIIEFRLKK